MAIYEVRHNLLPGGVLMTVEADDAYEAWETVVDDIYVVRQDEKGNDIDEPGEYEDETIDEERALRAYAEAWDR